MISGLVVNVAPSSHSTCVSIPSNSGNFVLIFSRLSSGFSHIVARNSPTVLSRPVLFVSLTSNAFCTHTCDCTLSCCVGQAVMFCISGILVPTLACANGSNLHGCGIILEKSIGLLFGVLDAVMAGRGFINRLVLSLVGFTSIL